MLEKIKKLFSSIKFWVVTLGFVSALLEQVSTGTLTSQYLFDALQVYLGVVAGIGTIDGIAERVSGVRR